MHPKCFAATHLISN